MSEHDESTQDPMPTPASTPVPAPGPAAEPVEPAGPPPAAAAVAVEPSAAEPAATEPRSRWRDRVFRVRAVAAVAVAGVILGAAGGAVTTALVSDHDRGDHRRPPEMGRFLQPGQLPAVPPDGRQVFPGVPDGQDDDSDDNSDDGSDGSGSSGSSGSFGSGTGAESSYARS